MSDLCCPVCHAEFDLAVLVKHAEDREAFDRITAHCTPLRARLVQYVTLFKTPKHKLSPKKQNHIALQVVPDIERGAITRASTLSMPARMSSGTVASQMASTRITPAPHAATSRNRPPRPPASAP